MAHALLRSGVREPVYFDKITKRITGLAHHHTGDLIAATRYTSLRGLLIVMMLQGNDDASRLLENDPTSFISVMVKSG